MNAMAPPVGCDEATIPGDIPFAAPCDTEVAYPENLDKSVLPDSQSWQFVYPHLFSGTHEIPDQSKDTDIDTLSDPCYQFGSCNCFANVCRP